MFTIIAYDPQQGVTYEDERQSIEFAVSRAKEASAAPHIAVVDIKFDGVLIATYKNGREL